MNRLYQVYDNGNLAATYTYDENGNRSTLTYANGVTTVYSYNKANLVTSLTNVKGDTLSSYSYTYYLDGNQATKTDNAGRVTTYQYDDMGRLTQESGGGVTKSYTFDSAGNRSGMTVTGTENYSVSYTYDLNNRLTKETKAYSDITLESLYTYDNNGNQVSKTEGSNVYTNIYNGFGQLTSSSKNSETIGAYSYKPDGLRMSKTVDGETTQFVWNGSDLFAELNVDGEIVNRYVYGTDLIKSSETSEYYLYNAHGDVVQLTNGFGQVTKTYEYDAFGNEVNPDDSDTNPFRYCGEYFDKETGTIYLRARYYDPQTGRFSSEDPIRDGLNWYTYCNNNPIMYVDPSGLALVNIVDYARAMGGTTKIYTNKEGKQCVSVIYNGITQNYTYYRSQKIDNSVLNDRFGWGAYAVSGIIYDLGKGWEARIDRANPDTKTQRHVHVYSGKKEWIQNEDGSPHDKNNNSPGSPPKKVLERLKRETDWDWNAKIEEFATTVEIITYSTYLIDYAIITYPDGHVVKTSIQSIFLPVPASLIWESYNLSSLYSQNGIQSNQFGGPLILPLPNLPPIPAPSFPPLPVPFFS